MNIALRLSYQVPEFSKTGKLKGFHLEHVARCNLIEEADFVEMLGGDIEKLSDAFAAKTGCADRLAKKFDLTPDQAKLIRYTGISVVRHSHEEVVPAIDSRWV